MKTRLLIPAFFILFTGLLFSEVTAQPAVRNHAMKFLRRTNVAIITAHKAVKTHKVYTGDLAKSVAHQRFARRLFRRGKYLLSIHHSRRARLLAFKAIRANKQAVNKNWEFAHEDDVYFKDAPGDAALEKELLSEMPDASFKDQDIVNESLDDLDISNVPPEQYKGK